LLAILFNIVIEVKMAKKGREISESIVLWDGKKCHLHEWNSVPHELCSDSFPWLVDDYRNGMQIAVDDWTLDEDGVWNKWTIGVKWDDLIEEFIAMDDDPKAAAQSREFLIETLERTIDRLKR